MKKLLILSIVLALSVGMVACGNKNPEPPVDEIEIEDVQDEEDLEGEEEVETEEESTDVDAEVKRSEERRVGKEC